MTICAPVAEHARPVFLGDGEVGVLLCHGFTGSPESLTDWAHAVHDADIAGGTTISLPRLPGHGTSWQELEITSWLDWYAVVEREYVKLANTCERVFVAGLSMGGGLALRLAEVFDPAGVMLVNPAIATHSRLIKATRVLRYVKRTTSSIASDIAMPNSREEDLGRVPLASVVEMQNLWRQVRKDLALINAPVLFCRSDVDHVVDSATDELILTRLPNVTRVRLPRSWHVATMDWDAQLIFDSSIRFIQRELAG